MAKVAFKQCDVERLLRAAKRVGYRNPAVDKRPDGTLRLLTEPPPADAPVEATPNPWDLALTDGEN